MTAEQDGLDPTAVLTEHQPTSTRCRTCEQVWPCDAYEMAEFALDLQAKVMRVGRLARSYRLGLRDLIDADDIAAALVDQPEQ